jgi:ABC-type Fe3+-siderophore transport system permease subunit
MLIIGWLIDPEEQKTHRILRTVNWCFICLAMLGGAFAALGGTILQLSGVYRNCICKSGLRYLVNHAGGTVELATDTQLDRDSWIVWWSNGIGALGFFSSVLILTCFYNMWMKENCKSIIEHEKFEEEEELERGVE